jgi:hypothetical protein
MSLARMARSRGSAGRRAPPALFDRMKRSDDSPSQLGETLFGFLNRVDDRYFAQVRALLNRWYRVLPDTERNRMYGSLRSGDDRQGHAAFWELYLFVALSRQGLQLEAHPHAPGVRRRPDWLVRGLDGTAFYLEATSLPVSDDDLRRYRRWAQIRDALNRMAIPDFWLAINRVEDSEVDPPGPSRVTRDVERWVSTVSYEAVIRAQSGAGGPAFPPRKQFEYPTGWSVTLSLYPKSAAGRGDPSHQAVGFDRGGWMFPDDPKRLQRFVGSLDAKARSYGKHLGHPLILAIIDLRDWPLEAPYVRRALYEGHDYVTPFWRQQKNGHVVAVITANGLRPWSVATTLPIIWRRPGQASLPGIPWHIETLYEHQESSASGAELLALPPSWPTGMPFSRRLGRQRRYRRAQIN